MRRCPMSTRLTTRLLHSNAPFLLSTLRHKVLTKLICFCVVFDPSVLLREERAPPPICSHLAQHSSNTRCNFDGRHHPRFRTCYRLQIARLQPANPPPRRKARMLGQDFATESQRNYSLALACGSFRRNRLGPKQTSRNDARWCNLNILAQAQQD